MTTTPISRPDQVRRDWLGRGLAAAAIAIALALVVVGDPGRQSTPAGSPTRLDDPAAITPARADADPALAAETPVADLRDIPLFSADDPAAPPIDKTSDRVLVVDAAGDLVELFDTLGYDYLAVGEIGISVPRLYLASLPGDLGADAHAGERPALFINVMLPLLLRVNEAVAADRATVLAFQAHLADGQSLDAVARTRLDALAERYRVDPDQPETDILAALKDRVDGVPPSLALAQAAVESGWGTSSLAQRANALFGQTGSSGIRASSGHTYAVFDGLLEAVEAYVHNLNTHPAYAEFRALRAAQRAAGETPDGRTLAGGLQAYSELGGEYIRYVRGLIGNYDLERLDDARLADPDNPADRPPAAI